jgi:SecD/SecF fusion protein
MQGHHLSAGLLAAIACALALAACGGGGDEVAGCAGDPPDDAVRVEFRMVPAPQYGVVTSDQAKETRENLCARAQALGVEDAVVRGEENQVEVYLSGENAERAAEVIDDPGHIGFYDWEANFVVDPALTAQSDRPTEVPFKTEYEAVRFAAAQPVDCSHEKCTVTGPIFYLYDLDTKELIEPPTLGAERLLSDRLSGEIDPEIEVQAIREGSIVAAEGPGNYFVLHDRAALTGAHIEEVEVVTDPETGEPAISLSLTEDGKRAYELITRRIAARGAADAAREAENEGRDPETAAAALAPGQAEALSGHFAIVIDGKVLDRTSVNFVESPDGLEAPERITLTGGFTQEEAEDLAALLEAGPPPVGLAQGD